MLFNGWPLRRKPPLHAAIYGDSGSPVVLLHGIASSAVAYEFAIPDLSSSHEVIAVDLLGFGLSPAPDTAQFTIDEHVDAIMASLKRLRVRRPVTLVGHSLGALIAIRLSARFPKWVSHLVLIAPPVYVPSEAMVDPVDRVQMDAYLKLYDFMRDNPYFTKTAAQALEKISPIRNLVDVTEGNWRAFSLSLEKCIESQTTITDLAQVHCPIDLIYGTLDPFLAPAGLRVVERLRGVATTRIDGVDHVIRPKLAKELVRLINHPSPATAPIRLVN
jgi:pimeloyl-ACP methyl ester carboxylesterase